MFGYLRGGVIPLVAAFMPIHAMADSLPTQARASGIPPLIFVQSDSQNLCQRRCEFDYQTCVQIVRENSSDGNYGGFQLIPEQKAQEFNQYAYEGCATKRRYCYRNCDRP